MIAAATETHRAPVERRWSPPPEREPNMSLVDAQAFALSLASTLMVSIVIFRAGDGTIGVMPATEYDGDEDTIVNELDPFAP